MTPNVRVFNSPNQPCDMLQLPPSSHEATSPLDRRRSIFSKRDQKTDKKKHRRSGNLNGCTNSTNCFDQEASADRRFMYLHSIENRSKSHNQLRKQNLEPDLASNDIQVPNMPKHLNFKIGNSSRDDCPSRRHDARGLGKQPRQKKEAVKKSAKRQRCSSPPATKIHHSTSKKCKQNNTLLKSLHCSAPNPDNREAEYPLASNSDSELTRSPDDGQNLILFQTDNIAPLTIAEHSQTDFKGRPFKVKETFEQSNKATIGVSNALSATNSAIHHSKPMGKDSLVERDKPNLSTESNLPHAGGNSRTHGKKKRKHTALNDTFTNGFVESKNKEKAQKNVNRYNVQLNNLRKRFKKKPPHVPRVSGAHFDDLVRTGRLQQNIMSQNVPSNRAVRHPKNLTLEKSRCISEASSLSNPLTQTEGNRIGTCVDDQVCQSSSRQNPLPDVTRVAMKSANEGVDMNHIKQFENGKNYMSHDSYVKTKRIVLDQNKQKFVNGTPNVTLEKQDIEDFAKEKGSFKRCKNGNDHQEPAVEDPKFHYSSQSYSGIEPCRKSVHFSNLKAADLNHISTNSQFESGFANDKQKVKNDKKTCFRDLRKSSLKVKSGKNRKVVQQLVLDEKMNSVTEAVQSKKPEERSHVAITARPPGESSHSGRARDDIIYVSDDNVPSNAVFQSSRKSSGIRRADNLPCAPEQESTLIGATKSFNIGIRKFSEEHAADSLHGSRLKDLGTASAYVEGDLLSGEDVSRESPFLTSDNRQNFVSFSKDSNSNVRTFANMKRTAEQNIQALSAAKASRESPNERQEGGSDEHERKQCEVSDIYNIQLSKDSEFGGAKDISEKNFSNPPTQMANGNCTSQSRYDIRNQELKHRTKCLWSAFSPRGRSGGANRCTNRIMHLNADSDEDTDGKSEQRVIIKKAATQRMQAHLQSSSTPSEAVIDLTACNESLNQTDAELEKTLKSLGELGISKPLVNVKNIFVGKFVEPLSVEEANAVKKVLRAPDDEPIVMSETGITLHGSDLKCLRRERWLNDELINAYVYLINKRNEEIFNRERAPPGIPKTRVFNTFFYTRLTSGPNGYDYAGVRRWTSRARIDISTYDLLLFPVNLGNHHWILAGIDLKGKSFLYLDSILASDKAGVTNTLRQWLKDELCDKHGEEVAAKRKIDKWEILLNSYRVLRCGVLPPELERTGAKPGRMAKVPHQKDGGSCGVFMAKMADCLSLGLQVYFQQPDIPLIRKRMVLDLVKKYIPM